MMNDSRTRAADDPSGSNVCEGKYRTLFQSIGAGFCTIEMLFDDAGDPVDCLFLEVNHAFEAQTGLSDVVGRRMRELRPDHEQYWFDIYGRVARTGRPERFEQEAKTLGRWYDVHAVRFGGSEDRQVAILFSDISDRKRAEAALRDSEERHRADLSRRVEAATAEIAAGRDLLQAIIDSSPDMIQVFEAVRDESGEIVDFTWVLNNHTSESRYGKIEGQRLLERNPGVIVEGIFDAFKRVTETGVPEQAERHYVHEQFDGWFLQSLVKLGDGVATTTKEITDWKAAQADLLRLQQQVAEARLRESEERLRAALHAGHMGHWEWDLESGEMSGSATMAELFGLAAGESWRGFADSLACVYSDDRDAYAATIERAGRGGTGWSTEFRIVRPRDGQIAWLEERATIAPAAGDTGRRITGFVWDVTGRRQAEEHRRTLLAELQHRVRNILAVIRSMIRRTHEQGQSAEEFIQHLEGRIGALARTQILLTRTVDAGVDLDTLIRGELLVHAADDARVTLSGPDVELAPKAAEILTLAVHELTTNSVKYGALSRDDAAIAIEWDVQVADGETRLRLRWSEQGVPMVQPVPLRQGFGTELITRRVAYELRGTGTLSMRPGGILCTLEFPLAPRASLLQTSIG